MSAPGESFPVTRLSVVAAARSNDAAERSLALEILFAAYWKPIYKYLRLKYAQAPQDAQDLTQGFFAELLERGLLAKFDAISSAAYSFSIFAGKQSQVGSEDDDARAVAPVR